MGLDPKTKPGEPMKTPPKPNRNYDANQGLTWGPLFSQSAENSKSISTLTLRNQRFHTLHPLNLMTHLNFPVGQHLAEYGGKCLPCTGAGLGARFNGFLRF